MTAADVAVQVDDDDDGPRSVTATAGDGAFTVAWEPPADVGSPLRYYIVQWRSGSEAWSSTEGQRRRTVTDLAGRTHTVTGVENGTAYETRGGR